MKQPHILDFSIDTNTINTNIQQLKIVVYIYQLYQEIIKGYQTKKGI